MPRIVQAAPVKPQPPTKPVDHVATLKALKGATEPRWESILQTIEKILAALIPISESIFGGSFGALDSNAKPSNPNAKIVIKG